MIFIDVDATEKDLSCVRIEIVQPQACISLEVVKSTSVSPQVRLTVCISFNQAIFNHALWKVGVRICNALIDLGFVDGVSYSQNAFGGAGSCADPELKVGQGLTPDPDGIRHIVTLGSGSVEVADQEFIVQQLVCGGGCGVIGARDCALARFSAAECRLCSIAPEVAAPSINVQSQHLRRRSKSDVGQVQIAEVIKGLRNLAPTQTSSIVFNEIGIEIFSPLEVYSNGSCRRRGSERKQS